ncbi:rhodanese-like domain-containing protein [Carboxylicivirga marina]|uniref:Rhodanese-like domain-containing protein n=1 Tax=Carboxylicivirga marina TaxID=2800988 RepID=A0ABS1HEA8_9BACT|nr:rhodanese-like domain-containing protein [Carboxylicivirga marina]MBK3516008.1 rhodanese-like domain-containing protein [Carboxylicivirga marina]
MKNLFRYSILMLAVSAMLFTGCKDDGDDADVSHFEIMTDYMVANNLDLPAIISGSEGDLKFVNPGPADEASVPTWAAGFDIIMDIRGGSDYAAGHIVGAQNVAWANVMTEANTVGQNAKILMVCYSGQSACYATSLLRLAGFDNAQALKWGMSGWASSCANHNSGWNNATGDLVSGHANWTNELTQSTFFNYPKFTASSSDGASILLERINAVFGAGFGAAAVSGSAVLDDPSAFCINNYYNEADHTEFGHFSGAYRIQPLTVGNDEIKHLDPESTVVTYCYTGQTSAVISAYLNVLGYSAKSMKAGMNGINNHSDVWTSGTNAGNNSKNQWKDSKPKDYPFGN